MSIRIMTEVWDNFPDGGSDLLALLALADWCNDEGRCWPSIQSIARKIRLSPVQARRIVHKLIDNGYVYVIDGKNGGRSSRCYQIVLSRLAPTANGRTIISARDNARESRPLSAVIVAHSHSCDSRTVSDPSVIHQGVSQRSRATRLPADWELPDEWSQWAMNQLHGLTPERIRISADSFRDYWISKAGKDASKVDWFATWRNWVRRDSEPKTVSRAKVTESFISRDYGKGGAL